MSSFNVRYESVCAAVRKIYDKQVEDGELTQDEADFAYGMARDEILDSMCEINEGYEEVIEKLPDDSDFYCDGDYWDDGCPIEERD